MGTRRAPYSNIYTTDGVSLKRRGEMMPDSEEDRMAAVADAAPKVAAALAAPPSVSRPRTSAIRAPGTLTGIASRYSLHFSFLRPVS